MAVIPNISLHQFPSTFYQRDDSLLQKQSLPLHKKKFHWGVSHLLSACKPWLSSVSK